MTKSILDAINEHKLKKIEASERYQTLLEKKAEQSAKLVKHMLNNGEATGDIFLGFILQQEYYKCMQDYTGKPNFSFPKEMTNRAKAFWTRVAECCEKAEVPPAQYMKAQFRWFSKTFGKAPEVYQLATEGAIERAKACTSTKKVVGSSLPYDGSFADKMKRSEKLMQDIMRAQGMTRYEVYLNLVIPGILLFPKEFVEADPAYRKALAAHA